MIVDHEKKTGDLVKMIGDHERKTGDLVKMIADLGRLIGSHARRIARHVNPPQESLNNPAQRGAPPHEEPHVFP